MLNTAVRGVGKIAKELGMDFAEAVVSNLHLASISIPHYSARLGLNLERDGLILSSKGS